MENSNRLNYRAAYDTKDFDITESLGLDALKVEASEYAYAIEVFFSEEDYKYSGKPDFEVY